MHSELMTQLLELRPAHDPSKAFGFVRVVISLEDYGCTT